MNLRHTERGFAIVEFDDCYHVPCSLQKSSLIAPDCVWLGVHENRARLTREMVRDLLPYLQRFVETGEIE